MSFVVARVESLSRAAGCKRADFWGGVYRRRPMIEMAIVGLGAWGLCVLERTVSRARGEHPPRRSRHHALLRPPRTIPGR